MPVRMPLFTERATTREREEPFRTSQGRIFRFWPSRWAVVVGWWSAPGDEEQLQLAHEGRNLATEVEEIAQWQGPGEQLPEIIDHTATP